ncbi:hypothetical protein [Vibrio sp. R78045]|uniref:hypothetical protein n=1 Tax=Vibrio sp. R78045 TaxID=3093868 RepID=UPI0036F2C6EB
MKTIKNVIQKVSQASLVLAATAMSSPLLASTESGDKRGLLNLVEDAGTLGTATGNTGKIWILVIGLFVVAGGFLTILMSNNQTSQKTKSAGGWAIVIGICLTGIGGVINMGNVFVTNETSEYSEYFDQQEQTPN